MELLNADLASPCAAVPGSKGQFFQASPDDRDGAMDGDACRLSAILARANREVARYIGRMTRNHDERRDLLADVTMRAWVGRANLFAAADPTVALITHAREACREWASCRRREVSLAAHFELPDLETNDEASISVDDAVRWIEWSNRVLSKLSARQRLAVDFHCRWNWSYEVVAQILDTSESTVRVHVWRGLRALRRVVLANPPPIAG